MLKGTLSHGGGQRENENGNVVAFVFEEYYVMRRVA
jgi:hypothetical protein